MTVDAHGDARSGRRPDRRRAGDAASVAEQPQARAVAAAAMLLSSAALVYLSLAVPGYIRDDWRPAFALTGVPCVVVGALLLHRRHLAGAGIAAVVLFGDIAIVLSAYASADRTGTTAGALLGIPTLFTATFLRPRTLGLQVAAAAGCAWAVNALVPAEPQVHAIRTAVLVVACTCPAVIVVLLRAQLDRAVVTDPLTGLLNRRGLEARFRAVVARARRRDLAVALLLVDVDHFKRVNDELGHLAGDEALRRVATTTAACVGPHDLVVRLGGEELVVVLAARPDEAARLGERVRHAVEQDAATPRLTVSVGGAWASPRSRDEDAVSWSLLDGLLGRADDLMYAAKRGGRNRVVLQADAA